MRNVLQVLGFIAGITLFISAILGAATAIVVPAFLCTLGLAIAVSIYDHKYPEPPDVSVYVHHGAAVSVITELKGKHRQHCLCHRCKLFVPGSRVLNCSIANQLYAICVDNSVVTPVYECAQFIGKL